MTSKQKVEVLLASEDGAWRTEIIEVPSHLDTENETEMRDYYHTNLVKLAQFEEVILFATYNTHPDPDDEGQW